MVPSVDLQLQAAIKALSDTVGPAVDPADKVASEQLHLVIATLGMVRERLPAQRRFIRRLLDDAVAIAGAVKAREQDDGHAEAGVVDRSARDRTGDGQGKSGYVRVDLGGVRIITNKK